MTAKWSNRKQCSAVGCKNYQCKCPHLAFHRFPNDTERCAVWVQNLKNECLKGVSYERLRQNYRVCSAHFDSSQFKRATDVHAGLKWNAVPSIVDTPHPTTPLDIKCKRKSPKTQRGLPPKKRKQSHIPTNAGTATKKGSQHSLSSVTADDAAGVEPSLARTALPITLEAAAREGALKKKIRSLKSQVCRLKMKVGELNRLKKNRDAAVSKELVMRQLKKLLPAKTYSFVHTQIGAYERRARASQWTAKDKTFFLSLLHASPKCYRLLFKVFSVPSVRTLLRLMKSKDFKHSLNHNLQDPMKEATESTKPREKGNVSNTDC